MPMLLMLYNALETTNTLKQIARILIPVLVDINSVKNTPKLYQTDVFKKYMWYIDKLNYLTCIK